MQIRVNPPIYKLGYYLSLFGTTIVLLWIGFFKFTKAEAKAIENLVQNHFLMSWMYDFLSVQMVSNIIGIIEIITAVFIVMSLFSSVCRTLASLFVVVIFVTTLSFLFTTPDMWHIVEGVPVTDFFILKDIVLLSTAFTLLKRPINDL